MSGWKVMIVAMAGDAAQAEAVRARLQHGWSSPRSCRFAVDANSSPSERLASHDALILLTDRATPFAAFTELLDLADELSIPVLVLLSDATSSEAVVRFKDAVVEALSCPTPRLCALLEGMLHRQVHVRELRRDAALNQRFRGGLKEQMSKMHEELQLAATIQRDFLPRDVPALHGVEFSALWRPSTYVSGDIYDIVRIDEDHMGVFIADAVGHGVPAALMTMIICRSLITKEISGSAYRILGPSEVLSRLNAELIRRQGRTTRFVTAAYAVVNCRSRTVTLAGAGHPPPMRLTSDGRIEWLMTDGGLLGVFADETFKQIEFDLAADDRLLFYTDGFEQAFPVSNGQTSSRRLPSNRYRLEFGRLGQQASAAEMVQVIGRRLDEQQGSLHQVDDLTLICMHAHALSNWSEQTPDERSDARRPSHDPRRPATELRLAS